MMKRHITLFMAVIGAFVISYSFSSCEGPQGPPGPPGLPGADGLIGSIFEAEVDFTPGNNYIQVIEFPNSIEVFDTDVVVAYILIDVDNGTDIWEPLPQTLFLGNEILLYGFDHTFADIRFFLDGTVDLDLLYQEEPSFTDGIIFRVAIIPADFAQSIDLNKMEDVMNALNVQDVNKVETKN